MVTEAEADTEVQHAAETDGITLVDGESVLHNRHPGWEIWWMHLLGAAIVLLYGISGGTETFQWGSLLAGVIVAYVIAGRNQSQYIVTDKRVIMDVGLIRRDHRADTLANVSEIATAQSYLGKKFGTGTIVVQSADGTETTWRGVPDHRAVAESIRDQLE